MTMVTTMRGRRIDLSAIIAQNEKAIAIGNAKMNARGDKIGPGGKIIKRQEEIVSDYYRSNPKAVKQVSLRNIAPDVFETAVTPVEALAAMKSKQDGQMKEDALKDEAPHQRRRKLSETED